MNKSKFIGLFVFLLNFSSLASDGDFSCNSSITNQEFVIHASLNVARLADHIYNCSTRFKAPPPYIRLLLDISHLNLTCDQTVTFSNIQRNESDNESVTLNCKSRKSFSVYSNDEQLVLNWQGNPSPVLLNFRLTPVLNCHPDCPNQFCCKNGDCISERLKCDKVLNCKNGEDEQDCAKKEEVSNLKPPPDSGGKTPDKLRQSVWAITDDLLSLTIVLSVIAIMIVVCVLYKCYERQCSNRNLPCDEATVTNVDRLELVNGIPHSPPPTYPSVQRQTSYSSQISQTSSQVSVPPNYEEAIDFHPASRRFNNTRWPGRNVHRFDGNGTARQSVFEDTIPESPEEDSSSLLPSA